MSSFKFSINTNALKKSRTTAQIVELCRQSGADGIEWGLNSLDTAAADALEMHKMTGAAGMEVVGYLGAGHLWKTDMIRRWSEAVAAANGRMLRVAAPWYAWDFEESLHQKDSFLALLDKARAGLESLIPLSREYGIRYVIEIHAGNIAASPWAVRELMRGLDPECVGAIYDPANTVLEGFIRPAGACELLGRHLAYVHAKNLFLTLSSKRALFDLPRRARWEMSKTFLEQGVIDYVEIFFALKKTGFSGYISLEEFIADEPLQEISDGIKFLKECATAAPNQPQKPYLKFNE